MEKNINSFENIKKLLTKEPSMRFNGTENFGVWQEKAHKTLYSLLGLDRMLKSECDDFHITKSEKKDGFSEIHFCFQSEPQYYVPCCMLIPDNQSASDGTFICLQGHSTGMHISYGVPHFKGDDKTIANGDRDFALRAVKEGFCAVCMEQRYMGLCGQSDDGEPACLNGDSLSGILLGRCAVGERVWDIMRLIDVLQEHFPELNLNQLGCIGNSGGGTTSFYSACIDSRIKITVPSCSVCTYKDSIGAMHHCACNYIPRIAEFFDMGDLSGLIAPRKLLIINGSEDIIFPMNGVLEAFETTKKYYKAAGAEENCELATGNGGHRMYADLAWSIIHKMLK